MDQGNKKIFLIRHAESQNNAAMKDVNRAWRRLITFQGVPSWKECSSVNTLLSYAMNTDLSSEGEIMISQLRRLLKNENFVEREKIELFVHSHLIRAKRTCYELFDLENYVENTVDPSPENNYNKVSDQNQCCPIVIEHPSLFEKDIMEHISYISGSDMSTRTKSFRRWLLEREEKSIVVVGHATFFKDMLGADSKMDNCEVMLVYLNKDTGEFHSSQTLLRGGQSLL